MIDARSEAALDLFYRKLGRYLLPENVEHAETVCADTGEYTDCIRPGPDETGKATDTKWRSPATRALSATTPVLGAKTGPNRKTRWNNLNHMKVLVSEHDTRVWLAPGHALPDTPAKKGGKQARYRDLKLLARQVPGDMPFRRIVTLPKGEEKKVEKNGKCTFEIDRVRAAYAGKIEFTDDPAQSWQGLLDSLKDGTLAIKGPYLLAEFGQSYLRMLPYLALSEGSRLIVCGTGEATEFDVANLRRAQQGFLALSNEEQFLIFDILKPRFDLHIKSKKKARPQSASDNAQPPSEAELHERAAGCPLVHRWLSTLPGMPEHREVLARFVKKQLDSST